MTKISDGGWRQVGCQLSACQPYRWCLMESTWYRSEHLFQKCQKEPGHWKPLLKMMKPWHLENRGTCAPAPTPTVTRSELCVTVSAFCQETQLNVFTTADPLLVSNIKWDTLRNAIKQPQRSQLRRILPSQQPLTHAIHRAHQLFLPLCSSLLCNSALYKQPATNKSPTTVNHFPTTSPALLT